MMARESPKIELHQHRKVDFFFFFPLDSMFVVHEHRNPPPSLKKKRKRKSGIRRRMLLCLTRRQGRHICPKQRNVHSELSEQTLWQHGFTLLHFLHPRRTGQSTASRWGEFKKDKKQHIHIYTGKNDSEIITAKPSRIFISPGLRQLSSF